MEAPNDRLVTRSAFDGLACAVSPNETNTIEKIGFVPPASPDAGGRRTAGTCACGQRTAALN
jgi:hypothetical protein